MDIGTALILVAVLVCPISMWVMMWMMRKDMNAEAGHKMKEHKELPADGMPIKEEQI